MTFEEFIRQILYVVITGIIPVVGVYISKFVKQYISEKKMDEDMIYIANAVEVITSVVSKVNQVYVDAVKKAGTFDASAQAHAKELAVTQCKELISVESKRAIENMYNNLDKYLDTKVEEIVRDQKTEVAK